MHSTRSEVAIIGSGFGGIAMGRQLLEAGADDFVIFEKGREVGGTWRDNHYPGAGCDVPSHLYSYSFERRYPWRWRYARQPEIHAYLRHCAQRFALQPHLRFGCEVRSADFDESRGLWVLRLASGEVHEARFVVSAVGQLSRPAIPRLDGEDQFRGERFHSACWNHDVDLRGKRVAVIGTGASAVQFVPPVARQAAHLTVFQRSPGWILPKVESPIGAVQRWLIDRLPWLQDLDRARIFGITELLSRAYRGSRWLERAVTWLARWQLRRQVPDPTLRARLTPDYPVGCKRVLLSNDWLPALARRNVEVVSERVSQFTRDGVCSADGREHAVDVVIYGTGFAATEFLAPMRVRGRNGRELGRAWRAGAEAYLGMAVHGFPNLFLMYGPNTNLGSGSIVYMLECQSRYIGQLVAARQRESWAWAEVAERAQSAFTDEVQARSAASTFSGNCQSWYKTADGRNTNNWIGSMREYARRTAQVDRAAFDFVQQPLGQSAQKAA